MSKLKVNVILAVLDVDNNEIYKYESWNPHEYSIEEYLEMRGHKITEVKF